MGRIEALIPNKNGIVREAVILLPSHRSIRRPLNLLVPLEVDEEGSQQDVAERVNCSNMEMDNSGQRKKPKGDTMQTEKIDSKYNLRPRQRVNYSENFIGTVRAISLPIKWNIMLGIFLFLFVSSGLKAESTQKDSRPRELLRCVPGGVQLLSSHHDHHELCAEEICLTFNTPRVNETIRFPPQVVLHEHLIQWKFQENGIIRTLEVTCPAAPFCENIDCTICAAVLFNPECWPVGALIVSAILLYLLLMGCYVFFYVPQVLGRPLRVLASLMCTGARFLLRVLFTKSLRRGRQKGMDLAQLLAISTVLAILLLPSVESCQELNVFTHRMTKCSTEKNICKVRVSEVLKVNSFKREACLKLRGNSTTLREVRLTWDSLLLVCEPQSMLFTRDTTYHVIDSKRCPRTGSCVNEKCAAINRSSVVPELSEGNQYPGVTSCVESCGGLGCDCFWWGSGCLFYRVYLKPRAQQVYEVFRCTRWTEAVKVKLKHSNALNGKTTSYVALLNPNIPLKWLSYSFTLSSVTVPPLPSLNVPFITDGRNTALWDSHLVPPLQCSTADAADKLQCEVMENCVCNPAETKANCNCREINISAWFQSLQNRLPVRTPSLTFFRDREGRVVARVPSMTTSEIILSLDEDLETELLVEESICRVDDALLIGCYKCSKGAIAQVTCKSSMPTQAEIICGEASFTIKCDEKGQQSALQFSFSQARVHITCSVSCGSTPTQFELTGILKFTHTAHAIANYWIEGKSNTVSEVGWPDFGHILDVLMQWNKSIFLAIIAVLIAVGLTMASKEEDGNIGLLENMAKIRSLDPHQIQDELEMAVVSIHRQKKIATTIINQWSHHKSEDSFLCSSAAEQMRLTTHCLREAELTKERILRMTTRFLIMDILYEYMTAWGDSPCFERLDWLAEKREYDIKPEKVLELVHNQTDALAREINDMKAMLEQQEKEMAQKDQLTSFQVQRIVQKEIELLKDQLSTRSELQALERKLEAQHDEIVRLIATTELTENEPALNPMEKEGKTEAVAEEREKSPNPVPIEQEGEFENDDESHWRRMVREVADEEEPPSKNPKTDAGNEDSWSRVTNLERVLARMEHDIKIFPFRDPHDQSSGITQWRNCAFCEEEGMHFSDACPRVRDGDTRYNMILRRGWCTHCLEGPRDHACRYRARECWYCYRVSGTVFEDLRPHDDGFHHRSLCNVPDKKYLAIQRIQDVQRELWRRRSGQGTSRDG